MGRDRVVLYAGLKGRGGEGLAEHLALEGYRVRFADGLLALRVACESGDVDLLVIVTWATGERARLNVLRAVRAGDLLPEVNPAIRVLWVAADEELPGVLRAFRAGADDVLRFPFYSAELLARVRALLRRGLAGAQDVVAYGPLVISTSSRYVTFAGAPLKLRPTEYRLLVHLARDPDRIWSRGELLADVWGYRLTLESHTVDQHARQLRAILREAGAEGWLVLIRSMGYRLAPNL